MAKTAVLIGATGLVGGHCLERLLVSPAYDRVVAVARRAIPRAHEKLSVLTGPFDQLGQLLADVRADDAFCCLGTTIRQAGTKAEFHKVDYGYSYEFAHRLRGNGATHLLLVSALGADSKSPVFYSRVKGLLEKDVLALGYPRLSVFRPSFLVGQRSQQRLGEAVGIQLSGLLAPLLRGPLSALHPIAGAEVAAAMVAAANQTWPDGCQVYRYQEMQALLAK